MKGSLALALLAVAGCASTPAASPHRPCSRWSHVDDAYVLNGFDRLTRAQAEGVAAGTARTLYLPELRVIDKEVAAALAKSTARSLHLCGLAALDIESAMELARYRSGGDCTLCLDGLTAATPEVLRALARTQSWGVSLNGLVTLDAAMVRALGSRESEFAHLEVCGVRTLSDEAAGELRTWQVKFCHLSGLEELSLAGAEALVSARIEMLDLSAVKQVAPAVAQVLGAWERGGRRVVVRESVRAEIERASRR